MICVLRFPVNFLGDFQISSVGNCLPHTCRGVEGGVVGEVKSISWGGAQTKGEVHKRKLAKNMFFQSDFFDITDFFPDATVFTIRKLALQTNEIKIQRAINQSNRIIHTFDLRLFPAQDVPDALILWYVSKIIFLS